MSNDSLSRRDLLRHNSTLVLLLDTFISLLASVFSIMFIRWQAHAYPDFQYYLAVWAALSIATSIISFLVFGTQKIVIRHSTYRSVGRLCFAVGLKELIMGSVLYFNLFHMRDTELTLMLLYADLASTLILLLLTRVVIIIVLEKISDSFEADVERLAVMVYGISDKSVAMVTRLIQSSHYNVIGFLTREKSRAGQILHDHKVYWFDDEKDIERLKVNLGVESILFSRDNDSEEEEDGLVKYCLHLGIHILTSPKLESVTYGGMSTRAIKQVVDNEFIPDGMSSLERNMKRLIDCVLSGLLLIIFSPLFAACWIALKLSDGGPALFKQERIGRFGRPFNIYKFRSMRLDAESTGPQLYSGDDDPRLTRVGGFLRRHHLDELPQLWNVFIGDMAFIGPRPERKFFIDQIMEQDPRYYYLYQIRPGVTSYATLKNGYTDTMEKMLRRLEFDLYYLRHRSAWFDFKILCQTFMNIVFGKTF